MGLSVLVSCTALLASVRAEFAGGFSNVMWQGGFETGNLNEYSEIVDNQFAGKEVTGGADGISPRCGNNFWKVTLNGGMIAYGHNRNEIGFHPTQQTRDGNMQGTVRYYGWSMAHSSSRPLRNSNYELAYWESSNVFTQTIGFFINDGNNIILRTRGNGDREVGRMNFEPGKWHDFVMGIKWSSGGDGWVELWKDGQQVVQRTSHPTLLGNNPSFSHFGVFRIPQVGDEVVMYYDCAVYSENFDPSGCWDDGECAPPPTSEPTQIPTALPTETPSAGPTSEPTAWPTPTPSELPTAVPTAEPTKAPTDPLSQGNSQGAQTSASQCAAPMAQCGGMNAQGVMMEDICCSGASTCIPLTPSFKQCQSLSSPVVEVTPSSEMDDISIPVLVGALSVMCLLLCCVLAMCWKLKSWNDDSSSYRKYSDESSSRSRRKRREGSRDRSRSRTRKKGKTKRTDSESSWVVDV